MKLGGASVAGVALFATAGAGGVLALPASDLEREFDEAAKEYKVPLEILLAIGYVNTAWEMPPPDASPYEKGDPHGHGAYGIMQLLQNPTANTLGEASNLTKISQSRLKRERAANILGGAAVLAKIMGKTTPGDLNAYYDAVAKYGGGSE